MRRLRLTLRENLKKSYWDNNILVTKKKKKEKEERIQLSTNFNRFVVDLDGFSIYKKIEDCDIQILVPRAN